MDTMSTWNLSAAKWCLKTLFLFFITRCCCDDNFVFEAGNHGPENLQQAKSVRYLLYDVNQGEGFNLRRDVYMRVANLVKSLNDDEPWVLVLPPWGQLYHWQSRHLDQTKIPWSTFFDLQSLRSYIPVIEFQQYLKVIGKPVIEEVYYLQGYKEGWTKWEEKMDIRECIGNTGFKKNDKGVWDHWFFGYDEVYANKFQCLSYMGHAVFIKPFLIHNTTARSVMLPRAEVLLHDRFGDSSYWKARRSMVYAKHLREIADEFRSKHLDSTDEADKTVLDDDWTKNTREHGSAMGGPYIGVHLRRKDYLYAHGKNLPSLKNAAEQLKVLLKNLNLKKVFVATDAPKEEFEELKGYFKKHDVYRFVPTTEIHEKYKDGGVSIIDQWICAHARHFIGSHVSTFSFRIQEDREILGFNPDTTYNRLCGDSDEDKDCEQPSRWTIAY